MPNRRDALKSAALLPFAALPRHAPAAPALAGPAVAGHFTHDSVRLWLQATEPAAVAIRYWRVDEGEEQAREMRLALTRESGHCAIADIGELAPGQRYRYRVSLEGGGARVGTFRTARAPGSAPGDFRVYIGSCAYTEVYTRGGNPYGANHHIFDTLAARMAADALPHFMLWLGDNLYLRGPSKTFNVPAEYSSAAHMELRYKDVRSMLQLRNLLSATHHYAIWDDHDYGENNSDKGFALKADSLRLFQAYWPNPPMGSAQLPGTWCRFTQEDAEFFLLDGRYYRDPEKAPADAAKVMYGRAQMDWLKRSLAQSRARFKVVAGGSQFLAEGAGSGWHGYPAERDDFLAWAAREGVKGVVLLSGDRHNTQLYRHAPEGGEPMHEFSCSPLTSKILPVTAADRANARLDRDSIVETQNYGTLEFAGAGAQRRLTARCFDADGASLWTRVIA